MHAKRNATLSMSVSTTRFCQVRLHRISRSIRNDVVKHPTAAMCTVPDRMLERTTQLVAVTARQKSPQAAVSGSAHRLLYTHIAQTHIWRRTHVLIMILYGVFTIMLSLIVSSEIVRPYTRQEMRAAPKRRIWAWYMALVFIFFGGAVASFK